MHKAGFVNIIGNANVGKSTLMNHMTGERLSVITSKAQTTRHRIMGIVNGDDYQIVYSDTPGIIKPGYELQRAMLAFVDSALEDADVILYITDVVESSEKNAEWLSRIRDSGIPVLLVINKIDLTDQEKLEALFDKWKGIMPDAEIFPASALRNFNLDNLFDRIKELLPESPPFFPKDQLTDRPMRFFVTEIIRGTILVNYHQEIPYSVQVEIEEYVEEPDITKISAVIHVVRDSQKGILIGKGGLALKKSGTQSRKELEAFLGRKVFLQLFVKVSKDWRDKRSRLRDFGYGS